MTRQAVIIRNSLLIKNLAHLMRLVAIHANRDGFRLLFPQFTFDDLTMHLLDLGMALEAALNNVLP
jgi:hypothetical protein